MKHITRLTGNSPEKKEIYWKNATLLRFSSFLERTKRGLEYDSSDPEPKSREDICWCQCAEQTLQLNCEEATWLYSQVRRSLERSKVIENLPLHDNEFKISEITYSDVQKSVQPICADCSTGYDSIPAKYLKLCIGDITSPICHIINESIKQNIFPNQYGKSRINPITKIKNPKDPSDFWPISILPILSKV